ncbi:hypothetical protein LXL04_017322 [Taraxacum kok-saghyz]
MEPVFFSSSLPASPFSGLPLRSSLPAIFRRQPSDPDNNPAIPTTTPCAIAISFSLSPAIPTTTPCAIAISFSLSSLTLWFCISKLCAAANSAFSTGELQGTHLSLLSLFLRSILSTRVLTKFVIDPIINFRPNCCLD